MSLPEGARVLTVQRQGEHLCLWALVDVGALMSPQSWRCYGTGHSIDPEVLRFEEYVATVQDGPYVWHVFRSTLGDPIGRSAEEARAFGRKA